jgi:uncharacterized membrane protein YcaP (DUF421 family)
MAEMKKIFSIDWHSLFSPTESLSEIFIRGTLMFLIMFTLLRIFRRQSGSVGIADLLVIVVIADAAQNGMAGDSKSITEAALLIITIFLWDYFFDWLGFNIKFFERILTPKPLPVIKAGKLIRKNMKSEMITYDEIMSHLRLQGIKNIDEVKIAYLEPDGQFSFIKNKDDGEN